MSALPGPSEFARSAREGDLSPLLASLLAGRTLSESDAYGAFSAMVDGVAHHAEMGALLALLATRLPTTDELVGAARVMRERVTAVRSSVDPESILDTAGTGGAPKTFNVSTAAAIVAAASGATVAKHGNRSRTGRGSAEVLAALGVDIDAPPETQARCLDRARVCFCFAIHHHPAARHAMPVRQALGFPTLFNLLGPLTNPAGARRQLMGVYDGRFLAPIAEALARLGARRALVVHSDDGLDECSIGGRTRVVEARDGAIREWTIDPRTLGLATAAPQELACATVAEAARRVEAILRGEERGPPRDLTLLNSAAALLAADTVGSIEEGISVAAASIDFGDAWKTFEALRDLSRTR